jgi:hypothetical protein
LAGGNPIGPRASAGFDLLTSAARGLRRQFAVRRPFHPMGHRARASARPVSRRDALDAREAPGEPWRLPGSRIARFYGFGLSVESAPNGATVHVAGRDVGETPIVTTVDCDLGQDIEVSVEKPGYRSIRRAVPCQDNALVEVSFKLRR